jgi:hypothetical protein
MADDFAVQLRAHAFDLAVLHYVEWLDRWSMHDHFVRWLTPPCGPMPLAIAANQHEVFAYALPDEGRLAAYLASAGPQQFDETDWFLTRLREAVTAGEKLVPRALIVVLRHSLGASVLDEEVTASLRTVPVWFSKVDRSGQIEQHNLGLVLARNYQLPLITDQGAIARRTGWLLNLTRPGGYLVPPVLHV